MAHRLMAAGTRHIPYSHSCRNTACEHLAGQAFCSFGIPCAGLVPGNPVWRRRPSGHLPEALPFGKGATLAKKSMPRLACDFGPGTRRGKRVTEWPLGSVSSPGRLSRVGE